MVDKQWLESALSLLRTSTQKYTPPASQLVVSRFGRDPFLILISCILSLRTKDTVSYPASCRLFAHAKSIDEMLQLSPEVIEASIYPVGFYRQKAKTILNICAVLKAKFKGRVPEAYEELLKLPGVGPKTANLVRAEGFNIPALCVDVHVHRISNRLGVIKTKTVEESQKALEAALPQKYWIEWNRLLVMWGQNICVPQSPYCSQCPLFDLCQRRGVTRSR